MDTIVPPNREYNAKNGFLLPFHPTWRFTWDQVGSEPGRVLGLLTAASGRGTFELLGNGTPPKAALVLDY